LILPEQHLRLVRLALRGLTRPEDEEDDIAEGVLVLVQSAQAWNAGRVGCAWTTFAVSRVRWGWIRRNFNRGKPRRVPEVPLYLSSPDDEEAEIERPEMARADPDLARTEARVDVENLLAGIPELEARILRRRFGLEGEPASVDALAAELRIPRSRVRRLEQKTIATLRKRAARPSTFQKLASGTGRRRLFEAGKASRGAVRRRIDP